MKGAIFNVGPLKNEYSGPHTYADVLLPFITELQRRREDLTWVGITLQNDQFNSKLEDLGVRWCSDFSLDVRGKIKLMSKSWDLLNAEAYDYLLCQPRPLANKLENQILFMLINKFLDANKKVFVWEQDMFTDEFTERMRNEVVFLHPAITPTGKFKREIYFPFFTYQRRDEWDKPERKIDFLFMGNIYGRQRQALDFFGKLNDAPFGKLVFGSWIQDEERKKFSSQFDKFEFAGNTEHWAAIPVMKRAKATLHIVPDFARDRGLMTARVFTSQMANCLCFCDAKIVGAGKFFPKELIVQDGDDIKKSWDWVQSNREELLAKRAELLKEHTVANRINQFLELIYE